MNDQQIFDELDRVAAAQGFAPVDTDAAIRAGVRARRRRTAAVAAGGLAATGTAVALAVVVASIAGGPADDPAGNPPITSPGRPGAPVAGAGGADDGYPDLVTSVSGRADVTITGFGWPLADTATVSTPDGQVAFPDVSEQEAVAACLPMLNAAAPTVPDRAWAHSAAGVEEFPARATLVAGFAAEHDGVSYQASCALPGDYVAPTRPDLATVPIRDDDALLAACSYLAHVDLTGWSVAQRADIGFVEVAALVSGDGHFARCVLSSDPAERSVQLSGAPISEVPAGELGTLLYSGYADALMLAGTVGPDVAAVEIAAGPGGTTRVDAVKGTFALAVAADGQDPPFGLAIRALDADDDVVDETTFGQTPPEGGPVSTECFTSVEQGNDGC